MGRLCKHKDKNKADNAVIDAILSLAEKEGPPAFYTPSEIASCVVRDPGYGRIGLEYVTGVLEPLVREDIVEKVYIKNKYGKIFCCGYSVDKSSIETLRSMKGENLHKIYK